jgi:probable F420-dependent oxidoreductase
VQDRLDLARVAWCDARDPVKVRIAVGLGATALDPPTFAALVTTLRPLGFDSLWLSEVLTGPGPDPLIALATAAQLDTDLKLGATLLLPGRHELRLAKALASLDVLSGGRVLLTFVPGLTRGLERDAVGVAVRDRAAVLDQALPRLRQWWAGEPVDGITLSPLPVQQPLEFWLGGLAAASLGRCGRLADGWLGAACSPAQASAARVAIDDAAAAVGRRIDPEHFGLSITYAHRPVDERQLAALAARNPDADPRTLVPVGYPALRALLQEFIAAGLSKFVLRPPAPPTPNDPASWRDELSALAGAVVDLQT